MSSVDDEISVASMFAALHVGSINKMQGHDAIGKKFDEEDWLMPNLTVYVKHKFELRLTWTVLDCPRLSWTVLDCPGLSWTVLDCFGVF